MSGEQAEKKATGPKRHPMQREEDLPLVSRLYCMGKSMRDIARELSTQRPYTLSYKTIFEDLKEVKARWLQSSLVDFNEAKARELAKIDHLEQVAWEGFERSLRPAVKEVADETRLAGTKAAKGKKAKSARLHFKKSTTTEHRDGETKWLDIVTRCIVQRCQLMGWNAPIKQEVSGPDGAAIEVRTTTEEIEHARKAYREHVLEKMRMQAVEQKAVAE